MFACCKCFKAQVYIYILTKLSYALMNPVPGGRSNVTVGAIAGSSIRFLIVIGMRIAVTTPAETVLIFSFTTPLTLLKQNMLDRCYSI